MAVNSTVQIINFSTVNHRIGTTNGKVNLPPALRRGTQATGLAGAAVSVDLATLTGGGRRALQMLYEMGNIVALPTGTVS